ncbi:hypothetical protein BS78_04G076000 [Paspalum vaginatum]|nr:hypothetical protein BS78_04G076000 [Paspalum vaginatum]
MVHASLVSLASPCASVSPRCWSPWEPKTILPSCRRRASSLKAACGLSRRRAVSETVVLGGAALSMSAQAAMLESDVIRYRKLDSGVKLEDVVEGEGPEAREGDLVQFNYVCRRANGYFVHSTVNQFSGESKPVTLPLGGEEMIRGLRDVLIGMKAGGKRRALIPPEVGYTSETLKPVPEEFGPRRSLLSHAKEPLVFEVQLLKDFLSIMGENKWMGKRWEDMDTDVLVKIFKELNLVELSPVSQVCRWWRSACSDPLIWGTLDFGLLKSNFIQTRASPYIWVDDRSDKRLSRILRVAMAISIQNVNCMIFHYNLYMKDEHLHFISQRSPHLKRLVMPAWNRITKAGICQAIQRWQELESLTMPAIGQPPYIMEEIGRSCKSFTELKIMGSFDQQFASAILQFLPKLKVLSLRCSKVSMDALHCLLNSMEYLEVLNISHCLLLVIAQNGRKQVVHELDSPIRERASRLREFHYCQSRSCIACQRMVVDEGIMRWYRYEDWFWRRDEVRSLDLQDYGKLFDADCERLTSVD